MHIQQESKVLYDRERSLESMQSNLLSEKQRLINDNQDLINELNKSQARAAQIQDVMKKELQQKSHQNYQTQQQREQEYLKQIDDQTNAMQKQILSMNEHGNMLDRELQAQRDSNNLLTQKHMHEIQALQKEHNQAIQDLKKKKKDKYILKTEQMKSKINSEATQKIEDAHKAHERQRQEIKDQHRVEVDQIIQRFEKRMSNEHVSIPHHEAIINKQINDKAFQHQKEINQIKKTYEDQIMQADLQARDIAAQKHEEVSEQIAQLNRRYETESRQAQTLIQEKDREIKLLVEQRDKKQNAKLELQSIETNLRNRIDDLNNTITHLESKLHKANDNIQSKDFELNEQRSQEQENTNHQKSQVQQLEQIINQKNMEIAESNKEIKSKDNSISILDRDLNLAYGKVRQLEEIQLTMKNRHQIQIKDIQWALKKEADRVARFKHELGILKKIIQSDLSITIQSFENQGKQLLNLIQQNQKSQNQTSDQNQRIDMQYNSVLLRLNETNIHKQKLEEENHLLKQELETKEQQFKSFEEENQIRFRQNEQANIQYSKTLHEEKKKNEDSRREQFTKMSELEDLLRESKEYKIITEGHLTASQEQIQQLIAYQDELIKKHNALLKETEERMKQEFDAKLKKKLTKAQNKHQEQIQQHESIKQRDLLIYQQEREQMIMRINKLESSLRSIKDKIKTQKEKKAQKDKQRKRSTQRIEQNVQMSLQKAFQNNHQAQNSEYLQAQGYQQRPDMINQYNPLQQLSYRQTQASPKSTRSGHYLSQQSLKYSQGEITKRNGDQRSQSPQMYPFLQSTLKSTTSNQNPLTMTHLQQTDKNKDLNDRVKLNLQNINQVVDQRDKKNQNMRINDEHLIQMNGENKVSFAARENNLDDRSSSYLLQAHNGENTFGQNSSDDDQ